MFFKKIETKGIAHYSYMVGDEDYIAVIDPMRDVAIYMEEARKAGKKIKYIFETHRNEDFVSGSIELGEKTGAEIYVSGHEYLEYSYGHKIMDGFEIEMGHLRLKAIHTPGHTLGHLSYALFENGNIHPYMVFTGDCLFMGDAGRTDFYGKDNLEKMTGLLYDSIFTRLLTLGDEALMFPAHGAGSACGQHMDERPFSTIGYERKHNQVLQVRSKDEFIENFAEMRVIPRYFDKMEEINLKGAPFVGDEIILNAFTLEEFKEIKDDVLLLDIRSRKAYIGGHIPGSIYMSKESISTFLGAMFKTDKKIIFITDNISELEEVYWYCKRIGFDNLLGFLPDGPTNWEHSGEELETVPTISAKDYRDITKEEDFILVDTREKEEIKEDDPDKNRINIPLQTIYKCHDQLEHGIPIYTLCGSGERSTIGYSYLKLEGYKPTVISGGIEALRHKE